MFSFMKKDKEKNKERKEMKKKDKEEKLRRKETRVKKERQNITPEEMSRLNDIKRSVIHRFSEKNRLSKKNVSETDQRVSKSDSSESFLSANSRSSSSSTILSSSHEAILGLSRSQSVTTNTNVKNALHNSVSMQQAPQSLVSGFCDLRNDASCLNDKTFLDAKFFAFSNDKRQKNVACTDTNVVLPKLAEIYDINLCVKSFNGIDLKLPVILPHKPRMYEVNIKRHASGEFGIKLYYETVPIFDRPTSQYAVFPESSLGEIHHSAPFFPGDRLIKINEANVETWSCDEIVEFIKSVGESATVIVEPIAELVEFSERFSRKWNYINKQLLDGTDETQNRISCECMQSLVNPGAQDVAEQDGLEAESVWLVHKGGFSSAQRQQCSGDGDSGPVSIKLDSGELLHVDDEDVEKRNPTSLDKVEDLTSLRYLSESSVLHVMRQRYAARLPHTYAGELLLAINPWQHLSLYSNKVVQMVKGGKQEDLPPHVYSAAQIVYDNLMSTQHDQSLVFMGYSGSGKSTSAYNCLNYLIQVAGCPGNNPSGMISRTSLSVRRQALCVFGKEAAEKLAAINVLLMAFGNCHTLQNSCASRFTQVFTLNFDSTGAIASASVQVLMFEKSRVVRCPDGEKTFNIFYYMLTGINEDMRNSLHLQHISHSNQFVPMLDKEENTLNASTQFDEVLKALGVVGASDDETKAILCILASICHLGEAGPSKGRHNKLQFTRPQSAQQAASLLGTTPEALAQCIFPQRTGTSTLSRNSSIRFGPSTLEKSRLQTVDPGTSVSEALDGFVMGLYTDAFNAVLSFINRCLSSSVHTLSSLVVVDSPGFQDPVSSGRVSGASFEDLCFNYLNERLQLFYHETCMTEPRRLYAQEGVECDFEPLTTGPANLVSLLDHSLQPGVVRSQSDRKNVEKKGLIWLLDEESTSQSPSQDGFLHRLYSQHADPHSGLLQRGHLDHTFVLKHNQGSSPIVYNTRGWLSSCRDSPTLRNSSIVLHDSKSPFISKVFGDSKGAIGGVRGGVSSGTEGYSQLHRSGSVRRAVTPCSGVFKKKSVCAQVKLQVDSMIEMLRKTQPYFVLCFLPHQSGGLCGEGGKSAIPDLNQIDVPLLRSQLRAFEVLDVLRLSRHGFPDFMFFQDFVLKFQGLISSSDSCSNSSSLDIKQRVVQILDELDIDMLTYKIGESRVFFRAGVLLHIAAARDEKVAGIVILFQAQCRGYLQRKLLERFRVQHIAVKCIQRNVQKYFGIREWPWWKLFAKIRPILNVQRTEEELSEAQEELAAMKTKTEKLEKERNEYKSACEKTEAQLAEVTADLLNENKTAIQAEELLETESAERLRLKKELKDLQTRYSPLKQQNETLKMELMQSRVWQAQSIEDEMDDDAEVGSSVYKERCERLLRELRVMKKQMQQQNEEDLEQELQSRKVVEKRLHEAVEEAEEQRRQVQVGKKKIQRLTSEMQDTKLHMEEQATRNNELERKQRRFDGELVIAREDAREERQLREKLQGERDRLVSEKYSFEQSVHTLQHEHQSALEKADRADKDLRDILTSGKDTSEAFLLRRCKHELEVKMRDQEDELDEQAGRIQQLEQSKLRLEMNMEKLKKEHISEMEEKEQELEEMRNKTLKKLRSMESQLEEEYEDKRRVVEEKNSLEQKLQERSMQLSTTAHSETERRLRRTLKKTRALLVDADTMLTKQRNTESTKQQIAQLRNQLDDAQFASAAAVKAKRRLELEIEDLHQQLDNMSHSRQEVDNKNMSSSREIANIQSQLEENEDDMAELMKKFKSAVQQQSVQQITLADQLQQIEDVSRQRDQYNQQVLELTAQVQFFTENFVDKHAVLRADTKLRDYESRLDLEYSQRQRLETQVTRLKEQLDKGMSEKDDLSSHCLLAEESLKRAQKQQRDLADELLGSQRKETEASERSKEMEAQLQQLGEELAQNRSDLRLAFKRITDLQAALEEEIDSEKDDSSPSSYSSEDDDDMDSYVSSQSSVGGRQTDASRSVY